MTTVDYRSINPTEVYEKTKYFIDTNSDSNIDELEYSIEEIAELVKYHEWRYYVQNDPIISDFEFDTLYKLLQKILTRYPEVTIDNNPLENVGSDLSDTLPKVKHYSPMLSLSNSYDSEDLIEFDKQVRKFTGIDSNQDIAYTTELKYDGGSISVLYENDKLVRAATRGNGEEGEDITHNALAFLTLPQNVLFSDFDIFRAELRGEALIRKDIFVALNEEREKNGLPLFANPRNTATGGLRMKEPSESAKRGIEVFIYQLGYAVDNTGKNMLSEWQSHYESINQLGKLGFMVPGKESRLCKNIDEVIDFCNTWEETRDQYPYEIDGIVIKVDARHIQEAAGYTAHHPRWAIAYKFRAKQASSKLLNVEFQVGKTGAVTPVAKIQPVSLAGVTISSISLHNEDFIKNKDIRIGDVVLVERAGDVIPYISESKKDIRTGEEKEIEFPKKCPSCNHELYKPANEAVWRCVNSKCNAQVLQKIIFHVSKEAMDIDGLGRSLIERLFKLGMIKSIPDVYRLDYDTLEKMEGLGKKSVSNLKTSIDTAKTRPLHRLLASLSIHHLGKKASKLIASNINHILDLHSINVDKLLSIKDIGPIVAENAITFFNDESNVSMIKELEELGVNLVRNENEDSTKLTENGIFSGKTILFTGTLHSINRKEAQDLAEKNGAKNISAVSSNLDILVVGEKAGSKLEKAQKLGSIQIMTEDEFLKLTLKDI